MKLKLTNKNFMRQKIYFIKTLCEISGMSVKEAKEISDAFDFQLDEPQSYFFDINLIENYDTDEFMKITEKVSMVDQAKQLMNMAINYDQFDFASDLLMVIKKHSDKDPFQ